MSESVARKPATGFIRIRPWERPRFINLNVDGVQCRIRFRRLCGPPLSTPLVEFGFRPRGGFCRTRFEVVG